MTPFTLDLAQFETNAGRAEALQLAQARVASDPDHPEWEHPAYWAAFVAAGAWGPLGDRMAVRSTAGESPA